MNTRAALLRAILEAPDDDTPRLIFADHLEIDCVEVARANYIRTQIKIARLRNLMCNRCDKFQEKQTRWTQRCRGDVCSLRRREYELSKRNIVWDWTGGIESGLPPLFCRDDFSRGFISRWSVRWTTFLAHHARLVWSPKQRVECPKCVGDKLNAVDEACDGCDGLGTVARPFTDELAATAQPIEIVELTDTPHDDGHSATLSDDGNTLDTGRRRFERVRCAACGGRGEVPSGEGIPYMMPCEQCGGTPQNSWTCEAWPSLVFKMPRAERPLGFSGRMHINRGSHDEPVWEDIGQVTYGRLDAADDATRERAAEERAERAYYAE